MKRQTFSIQQIPLVWLTLGCLVFCAAILLGVITIARPYVTDVKADVSLTSTVSPTHSIVAYTQTYSSDSASLYPSDQ